jgi:hypothetical protein
MCLREPNGLAFLAEQIHKIEKAHNVVSNYISQISGYKFKKGVNLVRWMFFGLYCIMDYILLLRLLLHLYSSENIFGKQVLLFF